MIQKKAILFSGWFACSVLCPWITVSTSEASTLELCHADGQKETLSRIEELPARLAKDTSPGTSRLIIDGAWELQKPLYLSLRPGQQLSIVGSGPAAVLDFGALPPTEPAIDLNQGQFELRGLTLRNGPGSCVQISRGVRYRLADLRMIDARGGGITVWGPCGADQAGPEGNSIEHCLIDRFNLLGAKWTHDGISLRDNHARVTGNVVRNSPTETMGIRVMGAYNRIEGNLVQNVALRDSGGIYLWGGEAIYTAVGNLVRGNIVVGAAHGIYLDDGTSAATVEQNYLIDCRKAAILVGGGRDNVVEDNVALDCPVLVHLDNRRVDWRDLPQKATLFADARARLQKALVTEGIRAQIAGGGLDVNAFETLPERAFNQPADNRIGGNVMMPPAMEFELQNYENRTAGLVGWATSSTKPDRMLSAPALDWRQLSGKALGISGMPDVSEILKALSGLP